MRMQTPEELKVSRRKAAKTVFALLGLAVFMYVSIMYKIIQYGP